MVEDIPLICVQLARFAQLYSRKYPPYKDLETSEKILQNIIENHLFYVAVKDDTHELVGFIAGFVCDHIYNPDIKVLTEAFWWTDEKHRRSGIGMQLLEAFEGWGKKNVDWIFMTIEEETPLDEKIFLDRGFKRKEINYIMEI